MNQLLAHARTLGFTVNQTLLDNTKPLRLNLQSEFELTNEVLDDIFIVAMKNPSYDMEKINETTYQVRLDKGQSLTITTNEKIKQSCRSHLETTHDLSLISLSITNSWSH